MQPPRVYAHCIVGSISYIIVAVLDVRLAEVDVRVIIHPRVLLVQRPDIEMVADGPRCTALMCLIQVLAYNRCSMLCLRKLVD
jgi:hypothetical protein